MLNAWKAGTLSTTNTKPLISNQIREPMPLHFVLQPPEEQTDNWDDDFEEGISLTKLQGNVIPHKARDFWLTSLYSPRQTCDRRGKAGN
jgi:hypothetical protein